MRGKAREGLLYGEFARAVLLMACFAAPAMAQGPVACAHRGGDHFVRKSARDQQRILAEVRAAVLAPVGSHHAAVQAVIAQSGARTDRPAKKPRVRKSSKRAPKTSSPTGFEFPLAVSYAHGRGVVEPIAGDRSTKENAARRVPMELALLGMLPDSDRALAELQSRLDSDRSADAFAAFLESWRNGAESFYEALDRTAGTEQGVFFYDAMLGDFVAEIVDPHHPSSKELKKSLDAAHDALHRAFLSYRQYRGFREAVALSLLLPPDVPLPQHLSRYEARAASAYSLREQVLMVLAVNDYDPMVVAELVRETAQPLPVPLWSQSYDPYVSWSTIFAGAMTQMVEAAGDTDAWLEAATDERQRQANLVRATAYEIVGIAPPQARH